MAYALMIAVLAAASGAAAYAASGALFKRDLAPYKDAARAAAAADYRRRSAARQARFDGLAARLERVIPLKSGEERELRDRLDAAGVKMDPTAWRLASVACAVVGCLAGCMLCQAIGLSGAAAPIGGAAGGAAGWCIAGLYLAARAASRSEEISRVLPSVLELLSIVVSAGMMVEQGFRQVSEDDSFYPLSEEFARVDREINQLGYTRVEALKSLSRRCGNVQMDYFCAAMIEATKKGSSIADVLMAQASFARKARRDALVEKARRLSSMMALPLSFFFIPAILIVVLAPQIGMLVQLFSSMQISF